MASGLERSGSVYSSRPLNCLLLVENTARLSFYSIFKGKQEREGCGGVEGREEGVGAGGSCKGLKKRRAFHSIRRWR